LDCIEGLRLNRETADNSLLGSQDGQTVSTADQNGVLRWFAALGIVLAAGILSAPRQAAAELSNGDEARIVFIAGFASAFDDRERLAGVFAVDDVSTEAYPPYLWHMVVRDIVRAFRRSEGHLHIILIGHSMGAVRAYEVAAALDRRGVPVDLIIGFDPERGVSVTDNVARAVNFFLTPDVDPVVPGPGFSGQLVNEVVGDIAVIAHHDIIYDDVLRRRTFDEIERALP